MLVGTTITVAVALGLPLDFYALLHFGGLLARYMKTITPVVEKHYQLILWLLPKIANFPKDQRFLLADRIEIILLDILELLIEAAYSKSKKEILRKANLRLEHLRFMFGGIFLLLDGYCNYWSELADSMRFLSLLAAFIVLMYIGYKKLAK